MRKIEKTIANRLSDLPQVSSIVDAMAAAGYLLPDAATDVNVALDEVLTNIITHGYGDDRLHEIRVCLTLYEGMFEALVEDDGKPFDPLTVAPPDVHASLRDRPVGGLGIHFVRSLMTEVQYSFVDNHNRLLLRLRLAEATEADADGSS
jgi:anti-sigma regulatory factor (Ser/Thr protein kinase)